jgi:hypothetical protein
MKSFAEINENNKVQRVIVADSKEWCESSLNGTWVECFTGDKRTEASIDDVYDLETKQFIPPKPYSKWLLNKDTFQWEAPIPYPEDGKEYVWNDNKGEWEEVVND